MKAVNLTNLSALTNLTEIEFLICSGAIFLAGMVRGFAGFALSAVVMASIVVLLPPVELIPICFILEAAASLAMLRNGVKNADMKIVWGLVIGSAIGAPLGLTLTTSISPDASKLVAVVIVLTLSILQLFRASPAFVGTRPRLYVSGLAAGVVTGLASIGGMVVALYILASKTEPKIMRASLVMFPFLGMFTSIFYLLWFGLMNAQALTRGLVFTPIVLVGVFCGSRMFRPSLTGFYKRFCLLLLVAMSVVGLLRML